MSYISGAEDKKENEASTNLVIEQLSIAAEGKPIVCNASLRIEAGEIHAVMGPNGSGKSSLAYALAGHPAYIVTSGTARLGATDLLAMKPEERAAAGLFLAFQEPPEIGGVSLQTFLATIGNGPIAEDAMSPLLGELHLDTAFLARSLNEGFSGGEKKKSELLQMIARGPKIAILDEVDAGLDVDALGGVVSLIRRLADSGTGVMVISHSPRIVRMLEPRIISVFIGGRIAQQGDGSILGAIERQGFSAWESASRN